MSKILKSSVLILNKYFLAVQVSTVQNAVSALFTGKARVINELYDSFDFKRWIDYTSENKSNSEVTGKYIGTINSPSISILAPQVIIFPDCKYTSPLIKAVKYSRKNIFHRDNHICQYCNKKFKANELNIDHIVPRSRGGSNSWNNLVTSCISCNAKKDNSLLSEIGWKLTKEPKEPEWKSHIGKPFSMIKRKYWKNFLK